MKRDGMYENRAYGQESNVGFDVWPEMGVVRDRPYFIHLERACRMVRVEYRAGYKTSEMPPDLQSACIELVAWNYARHSNRKIGIKCDIETKMPENITNILERWRWKTI
jgi:hypothetical protein